MTLFGRLTLLTLAYTAVTLLGGTFLYTLWGEHDYGARLLWGITLSAVYGWFCWRRLTS